MRWFRSLWALIIMLALYLVPISFHFDAIAAVAGRPGAWGFAGLYFAWGLLFGIITAQRESVTALLLTLWPGLLLVVTSLGIVIDGAFAALVVIGILYVPLTAVIGGVAAREVIDIATRRFEANRRPTARRIASWIYISTALLLLAMCLSARYPDLFVGATLDAPITWWLFYVELMADAASFGLLSAVGISFSGIQPAGILDGGLWWLSRSLLDVIIVATLLDQLRGGRRGFGETLFGGH